MYKLIIADDEVWIRERLKNTIDWETFGIELVGIARNGQEAINLTIALQPDIIITDIRMPYLDGLEYIKRIREMKCEAKIILISGYGDFEYAKKAIELGATAYILKPFEDKELFEVISKTISELNAIYEQKCKVIDAEKIICDNIQVQKNRFIFQLIDGYFDSDVEIEKQTAKLKINFIGKQHVCIVVQVENYEHIDKEKLDKQTYLFALQNISKELFERCGNVESLSINNSLIFVISSSIEKCDLRRRVISLANGLRRFAWRILGNHVTIGIGFIYDTLAYIPISYSEALEAVNYKSYYGINKVYDIQNIDVNFRSNPGFDYSVNNLVELLNYGNKEGIYNEIDAIINNIFSNRRTVYPIDIKFLFSDIATSIIKTLSRSKNTSSFSEYCLIYFKQLEKLSGVEEASAWLKSFVERILENRDKKDTGKNRLIVQKALDFIHEHYMEPITLATLSNVLYFNASYLCKIIKDVTGEQFTKHLMNYRILKAIELLKDPTLKVYQIAEMVGYTDIQYFTRIFKSITGSSPIQFRDKH